MRTQRMIFLATLAAVGLHSVPAEAVDLYIDRTRRTVTVPDECTNPGAALSQALAYDNALAPNISPVGALNLAGVEGRFTLLLSESPHLRARAHNNAFEVAWYNFHPGTGADFNRDMTNEKRLMRAYILMRCGLPFTNGDRNIYPIPAPGAARTNFIQFAMGDRNGPDPRGGTETGFTLIGNGEREGILMHAAERIKFDLTPLIVARNQVCLLYAANDNAYGCAIAVNEPQAGDSTLGYLWQGMNRVSYTAHEFWMMFKIDNYRNKVFFVGGTVNAGGHDVDRFVINGGALWHEAGGDRTVYPNGGGGQVPYRFNNIVTGANHERTFYQTTLQQFLARNNPKFIADQTMF